MLSKFMSLIHTQCGLGWAGNCATVLGSRGSCAPAGAPVPASAAARSATPSDRDLTSARDMALGFLSRRGLSVLDLREKALYHSELECSQGSQNAILARLKRFADCFLPCPLRGR